MKKVTYRPPYQTIGATVVDSNGVAVTNFRDEDMAADYVVFLNSKEDLKFIGAERPLLNKRLPYPINVDKAEEFREFLETKTIKLTKISLWDKLKLMFFK